MAYALLGHGAEHLSAPRHEVPAGSMLVVTEECGMSGTLPFHIYEAFQSPELAPLFADPVGHRRALEVLLRRRIKIYRAGASYPHMTFTLINDDEAGAGENPDEVDVGPSGIWPIPSKSQSMWYRPDSVGYERYTVEAENAGSTYSGSIFPFDAAGRAALAGLSLRELRAQPSVRTSVSAILAAQPGIYYHFLCRTLAGPDENLEDIMGSAFSENAQRLFYRTNAAPVHNVPALIQNWLEERPVIAPTRKQAEALNRMNAIVRRVMTRRRASRSSSGRRYVEGKAVWVAAHRRISTGVGSAEKRTALALAVPAPMLNNQDSHDGSTLLIAAARQGDAAIVRLLLERGASLTIADWEKMTPLHWGARATSAAETVAALLAAGATATIDENRNTVLHGATAGAIPLLIAAGVSPAEQNGVGATPLHIAASDGDIDAVTALLSIPGLPVNVRDRDGETPLMVAAREGADEIVEALLTAGADVTIRSNSKKTALALAFEAKSEDTILTLLGAGAPVADWTKFRAMALRAHFDRVVAAINARA
jgi:ankyrin repeat protein